MSADTFRAVCAELLSGLDELANPRYPFPGYTRCAMARARTLLAQPVAEGPKPVVDYSRVPEIATEAQIRSAAQYLVKKRNCDGDLIPAIEYAIARWGRPTPQPPADGEVGELVRWLLAHADEHTEESDGPYTRAADLLERLASPACYVLDPSPEALALLKAAGPGTIEALPAERTVLVPVAVSERPWDRDGWSDEEGQCWMGDPGGGGFIPSWRLCRPEDAPNMQASLPANALPLPQTHGI